MTKCYLALGSNLGDKKQNIDKAIKELAEKLSISRMSSWYETEPEGGPEGQDNFLNGVIEIETDLSAIKLLELCQGIEDNLGRDRNVERWGPRCIDIDIILYGDSIINNTAANLTIPHAMMCQRKFVLEPLCEIAPDTVHPGNGKTARKLLEDLENK